MAKLWWVFGFAILCSARASTSVSGTPPEVMTRQLLHEIAELHAHLDPSARRRLANEVCDEESEMEDAAEVAAGAVVGLVLGGAIGAGVTMVLMRRARECEEVDRLSLVEMQGTDQT